MIRVALVCKLRYVERTTVWVVTTVVRWRWKGSYKSRLLHFLLPARWDNFFNSYQPYYNEEGTLLLEDGRNYPSVESYIENRLGVPYDRINVVKIKVIYEETNQ